MLRGHLDRVTLGLGVGSGCGLEGASGKLKLGTADMGVFSFPRLSSCTFTCSTLCVSVICQSKAFNLE